MERKQRKSVKGYKNLLKTGTSVSNTVIPTTFTSMQPDVLQTPESLAKDAACLNNYQPPQLYRSTRQRTSLQNANCNTIINAATEPTTTPTTYVQLAQQQQQLQTATVQKGHSTMSNQTSMSAKAAACIASPMEQLAAVHAKATSSRNKNEEAINDLKTRIQKIENIFDIHGRIGNGTFSTVLLATLKQQRDLPEHLKRKFAIKHHIPTSHPDRIMKELQYMAKIGGTENVVGIDCCIRCNESVAFIMPFLAHDRFHDFYNKMDVVEVQLYLKNLLIALRHVHRFNVIHRDVKPSNFLYNRRKKQFLLVDFGLAQQMAASHISLTNNNNNSNSSLLTERLESLALPLTPKKNGAGEGKRPVENDELNVTKSSAVAFPVTGAGLIPVSTAKRLRCSVPPPATVPVQEQKTPSVVVPTGPVTRASNAYANSGTLSHTPFKKPLKQINEISNTQTVGSKGAAAASEGSNASACEHKSAGRAAAHSMSSRLQQKLRAQDGVESVQQSSMHTSSIGCGGGRHTPPVTPAANTNNNNNNIDSKYNTNRNFSSSNSPKCYCYGHPQVCNVCLVKKEIHASRAGTPGYRPPEVLLKYPDQTTAVDVWAAGVIFLSILTSVYPFFKAPNDYVALAEMITIFGDRIIRKTACILDRLVTLSQKTKPLDLRKLCVRFKNRAKFSSPELLKKYQHIDGTCEVCKNCDQFFFNCLCLESNFVTEPIDDDDMFPPSAYDLLHRLLEINPHKRITADEALKHPFFLKCHNNNNNNKTTSSPVTTSAPVRTSAVTLDTPTPFNLEAAGDSNKKTRN